MQRFKACLCCEIASRNIEVLTTLLTQAFGDLNLKVTAQQEMHNLKQANRNFSTYLTEFLRLAPNTGYDDNSKLAALREGLFHELRTLLLTILDEPDNFDYYVTLLRKLDSKLQVEKHQSKPFVTRASNTSVNTVRNNTGNINTAPSFANIVCSTPAVSSTAVPASTMTGTHPGPIDLSSGRFQKLSQEEKDRRNREGLCQYCRGPGHIARVCPNISKPKPMRVAELDMLSDTDQGLENV